MSGAALEPQATIGILGGGQLGRMLALAAARLGFKCHVLAPSPDSPAFDVVQNNFSYNEERGVTRGLHAEPWEKYI